MPQNNPKNTANKKIMIISRKPPCGSSNAREALDVMLMGSAFTDELCVVFMDDGVFQLKKNQNTQSIDQKSVSETYKALAVYDINNIYTDNQSLLERQLSNDDLIIPVMVLDTDELGQLMKQQDVILTF
jgi:tRNA 2-thiouridine synthesizing protein C